MFIIISKEAILKKTTKNYSKKLKLKGNTSIHSNDPKEGTKGEAE